VLNALEPSCVLGGEDTSAADDIMKLQIMKAATGKTTGSAKPQSTRKSAGRSTSSGLRPGSHTDAVMALSWNTIHKQVIASGSADGLVKLWDVTKAGSGSDNEANAATFTHHKSKVQSVAWNPTEATLLATGSYDRTIALLDARSGDASSNVKSVRITADCEALAWDPFHSEYLTVVSEDGTICCWDVRKFETSSPLWSFVASEFGGVTDVSYNAKVPGMMATCSIDKTVTLWDAQNLQNEKTSVAPRSCGSKDMCAGKLYTVGFYPSSPWLLGCGGSGNQLSLWDLSSEDSIQKRFNGRLSGAESNADTPIAVDSTSPLLISQPSPPTTEEAPAASKKMSTSNRKKGKAKKKAHKRT
jgi:periodic tryptophan protein 1